MKPMTNKEIVVAKNKFGHVNFFASWIFEKYKKIDDWTPILYTSKLQIAIEVKSNLKNQRA